MLRYRLEGSGSPLLLIHGWGVTYAIWQSLAPLLKPHFQLIMVELPGHGGSPNVAPNQPYYQVCADAIEEVRQFLGIEQWAMLAYSSGTRAAEAYAKRYPQSLNHAIFLCPTYILEIWALFVRLLDVPHPPTLTQWVFSDWRIHSLVRAFGFNWQRHQYTSIWKDEIELQPIDVLVRSLYEMPEQGRAPFYIPPVPTLFIWGGRDALIARPRHLGPHDVVIPANHSAPMMAAPLVAEVVLPFLLEDRIVSTSSRKRKTSLGPSLLRSNTVAKSKKGAKTNARTLRSMERKRLKEQHLLGKQPLFTLQKRAQLQVPPTTVKMKKPAARRPLKKKY
ncbi:alpha/beta fold hydrolase [Dictyobacter arantiisoli]|uniref:AB hydrolase-1 domain-containing protein n=1 Tax=Dictyobacter arantiisoli TaxID=2014874 RepID=A0A5A5TGI5_9CHLR|nr:alpha/beta hydrolase [Dictyobacter arantiisoli]GCF10345.1 hypothetical protein KDI_39090 [Dictyobacter arantiisoli]